MAMETIALLRSLLYQAKKAKTLEDAINAITIMCSKEDIATVDDQIAKEQKKDKQFE
jgi:predicted lysophospholipase L1 biosynthesis ABC-type transport system permease subunit